MMSETVDELVMARRRMEHQKLINELHRTNNILGISLLVTSLTAVLMAMVVYSCFVTLQCVRVTLIKNLLVSVLFQGHFTLILQVLLFMARTENLPDTRCFFKRTSFCEAIISGSKFFELTTLSWMAVISYNQWCRSKPKLNNKFYFLRFSLAGWISPGLPTAVWVGLVARRNSFKCWMGHTAMSEIAVLELSKLVFILLSLLFLVVTYANLYYSREIINVEEVLKLRTQCHLFACALFWLTLGHVVYVSCAHARYALDYFSTAAWTYIINVLLSSTGLVTSVCFCFVDADVRVTLQTPNNHRVPA